MRLPVALVVSLLIGGLTVAAESASAPPPPGSAAETADNPVRPRNGRHDSEARIARLLVGSDDLARKTDPFDLTNEFRSVAGVAYGDRCDHLYLFDAHVAEEQPVAFQRGKRTPLAIVLELSCFAQPRAQPGHHLLVEDRRRRPLAARINDEPDRVRADIDYRDRLAVTHLAAAFEAELRNLASLLERLPAS